MKRMLLFGALSLYAALPLAAQEEGYRHYHYRYRVESPYQNFGKMGQEFGRMGREYGRMGRDYARMYSRDWGRQWRGQEFGRQFRSFSHDMYRNWGRGWGRMGPDFQWRGYSPMWRSHPRQGYI